MFEQYCCDGAKYLKGKGVLAFLKDENTNVPVEHIFLGSLPTGYAFDVLNNIKSADLLQKISEVEDSVVEPMLMNDDEYVAADADLEFMDENNVHGSFVNDDSGNYLSEEEGEKRICGKKK